jgi:hypothetical protein
LDQLDWQAVTPLQIYSAILGRLPESAKVAMPEGPYSSRRAAERALLSREFQEGVLERLLSAFPEKRRMLFVHVPKCAGTDLTQHFQSKYPSIWLSLTRPVNADKSALFAALKAFVTRLDSSDSVFVCGHIPLRRYVRNSLYRYGDRIFSVVRDPQELAVSQVNYVFKRFFEAPRCQQPDTREWADALGFEAFDTKLTADELHAMALRALRIPQIVSGREICRFLGAGTAETALDMMARCDIEVTEVRKYNTWLKAEWGLDVDTRANESRKIISLSELGSADRRYLAEICEEDMRIYDPIVSRIGDGYSVRGTQLVAH